MKPVKTNLLPKINRMEAEQELFPYILKKEPGIRTPKFTLWMQTGQNKTG
jgi:hypothetical protein